jgi:hypothetical protein
MPIFNCGYSAAAMTLMSFPIQGTKAVWPGNFMGV